MQEIEVKFTHAQHDEVSRWFKTVKDHVVADSRREDFQVWCYYEGTFAVSTLYYTGTYFKCVHEIYAYSPFRELDSEYSAALEQQVERVRDAFDWGNGVWGPIQDVLGQRFVGAIGETSAALLSYKDMCELLDSGDPLKFGPFLRLLDMYWSTLDLKNVQAIRMALDDLLKFIESRRIAR
jgi:hypothetical protein